VPLLDLSLVTQTLLNTLKNNVEGFDVWPPGEVLTVTPQPPDKLKGAHTLGCYLYHARETAHTKAQQWPIDDEAPQRYMPMGLNLYYLLTAHSEVVDTSQQVFDEQRMMGLAIKTFRDFSRLNRDSLVRGVKVFPAALDKGDNEILLSLLPLQFNEAMQYWTVGSQPLRFAAYYEVAATLLEPERPARGRGRVLTYGAQVFLRPGPRLDGTRNTIAVTLPGEPAPRPFELDPAEVTYLDLFEVYGSNLSGDRTELLLTGEDWAAPVAVDAAWALQAGENRVQARAQEIAGAEAVLPGVYAAAIRVTSFRAMPDGRTRGFENLSNSVALTIAPRVTALPATLAAGVTGTLAGRRFDPAVLIDDQVQMFVGPARLIRRAVPPAAAGEFRVVNASDIEFRLPAGVAVGEVLPVKLVVNGAESAPRWITVA
jgi:hypothetical protein